MHTLHTPGIGECALLMDHYGMLANIRQHSLVVARLADQIVTSLHHNAKIPMVADRQLVIAGALLHDIAKTPCLENECDHAQLGAEICRKHGYHLVAEIVAEHVIMQTHEPSLCETGHFTAKEIVYYADKRVRHNQVVSLSERLDYILDHYGQGIPERQMRIRQNFQRCLHLEKLLFRWLDFTPEQLGAFPDQLVPHKAVP